MTEVGDIAGIVGLDASEVSFLADASAKDRTALARAIDQAGRDRDEELRVAVDRALGFVPRPLRGRIVKLLGGQRRG